MICLGGGLRSLSAFQVLFFTFVQRHVGYVCPTIFGSKRPDVAIMKFSVTVIMSGYISNQYYAF